MFLGVESSAFQHPQMDERTWLNLEVLSKTTTQLVLAANLKRLMADHPDLGTQAALSKRCRIAQSTVARILSANQAAQIDSLEALAKAFRLEPWQLLVPDLDPRQPPLLRALNQHERELYERIALAAQELVGYKTK